MKSVILTFALFIGLYAGAQNRQGKNVSQEQFASLATKKMTLDLDLNEKQQTKIYQLNLENAIARKLRMAAFKDAKTTNQNRKMNSDERYAVKSELLDYQIAQKKKMKNILTNAQFEKWEKMNHERMERRQENKGKNGERGDKGSGKKNRMEKNE
jgi:hypothetical protein